MTARPVMLITGASRGIGAATALLAAERGWDVVVNYANAVDAAEGVAEQCRAHGARALTVRADVSVEQEVVDLFETAVAGLGPLRAVVNNAGTLRTAARLDQMDVARIREVVDVNVVGAFLVAREAVRRLSTRHGGTGGAIVNVSSAASVLGSPNEFIDYAATKGAMDTLTVGLAKEVATEGIRVNAVRPGLIHTDIHALSGITDRVAKLTPNVPMQRAGEPAEVAECIVWLASDAASYVTGALLSVSGGR